ncbi:cilia- and flagella-associated protein 251 isoform X2 [Ascaphus truei]|uniref:cilia- and flagella-associated protein 251 isoform X2 n=1 Tax=Ascaphus truei TaxID=8439 RepID=UPI003F5ABF76
MGTLCGLHAVARQRQAVAAAVEVLTTMSDTHGNPHEETVHENTESRDVGQGESPEETPKTEAENSNVEQELSQLSESPEVHLLSDSGHTEARSEEHEEGGAGEGEAMEQAHSAASLEEITLNRSGATKTDIFRTQHAEYSAEQEVYREEVAVSQGGKEEEQDNGTTSPSEDQRSGATETAIFRTQHAEYSAEQEVYREEVAVSQGGKEEEQDNGTTSPSEDQRSGATETDISRTQHVKYSAEQEVYSEEVAVSQGGKEEEQDNGTTSPSEDQGPGVSETNILRTQQEEYSAEPELYREEAAMSQDGNEEQDSDTTSPSEDQRCAVRGPQLHQGEQHTNKNKSIQKGTTAPDGNVVDDLSKERDDLERGHPQQRFSEICDRDQRLQLEAKERQRSAEGKQLMSSYEDVRGKEALEGKATERPSIRDQEAGPTETSLVYTSNSRTVFEDANLSPTANPLNLSWSFGMNNNLPVHNLHDEDHQVILYVCAHTAVIHDFRLNRQHHLQGHCSCISCVCVSDDRRWIATADRGPESLIIVWDAFSGIPVHTIFDSHPEGGVVAIAMSQNTKYLATIGGGTIQRVCIWGWTKGTGKPICTAELSPDFGLQKYIIFNPRDHAQLITNSETQVIFYAWQNDTSLEYVAPPLSDTTFNKPVGAFSQSVFDFSAGKAFTGTYAGKLVVWETIYIPSISAKTPIKAHNKKPLKLMHLQNDGITVLTTHDRYFVTGDVQGHVKFYDQQLQLLNGYSHFRLAPIRSISFSTCPPRTASNETNYPQDCSIWGDQFAISNFIASTSDALVLHVFTEGTMLRKVLQESSEAVHALAAHPCKPQIAIGSYNGVLKVWDYRGRNHFISRIFGKGKRLHCLSYDPTGFLLGAGFTDGSVHVLDAITLEEECAEPFKYARGTITHITFSHDSRYLATADDEFTVTLFKLITQNGRAAWEYFGRYRSHYKPVQSIVFGIHLDSDEPRLLSLGMDRMLVEYDLINSSKGRLQVHSRDRIDQSAIPQCLAWYPPLTKECFILIPNDQHKMKLYNATTKMCRHTVLGPTFGSPIKKMEVLSSVNNHDASKGYLAYIIDDKVGLQILPVDGNPHKSTALTCHPEGVSNLVCSHDGRYVFTAGGNDCTVYMWQTNLQALEAVASLGGADLIPFYGLLEGGRDGALFKEMEDYFYYAQLRSQGIDTMETRQVSTHIPLKEVPVIMRALGFYPTEQEVENMLNEVKFSQYVDTGKQVTHINLGDFIKLYINHRPAFGLCMTEIQRAFKVLGFANEIAEQAIGRGNFLQLLQTRGEHMTEEELAEYLTTLLGLNAEGGSSELCTYDSAGAAELLEQEIPEEITTDMFAAEILGLPVRATEAYEEPIPNPAAAAS